MKNIVRTLLLGSCLLGTLCLRAQVPILNSYPSATATIFLDFDGHRVVGTSWNYMGAIDCAPSGLSEAKIIEIFNRVAEDYRPFNINVTTDSTRFLASALTQRTRVILTTTYEWYGTAGGVAFVGSFSWPDDNPCFVFTGLHGYRTKDIAEATAHEAGHTLGLYHQSRYDETCNKVSDYHSGAGSGEIGWAPIMGVGYSRNFTLWHNGPNSYGCNNFQNDLDVITSAANGFGYRNDDHGTSFADATVPVFSNNSFEMTGIIERNTDLDYFRFIMPGSGRFELDAIPYNVGTGNAGSDLDLQVTLYDENEVALSTYNPGSLLNSIADTTLSTGTYYLKVEGKGNLYAPEYASLGSYSLLANIDVDGGTVLPLHRFQLNGAWLQGKHNLNWLIEADEQVVAQSIEISHDGRLYETLLPVEAQSRQHVYLPDHPALATYYRIRAELEDGRRYYSNTIVIREDMKGSRPRLLQNPAKANAIRVEAPFACEYRLLDLNGRLISSGKLQAGVQQLPAQGIPAGFYLLQYLHEREQWNDKVLIQ